MRKYRKKHNQIPGVKVIHHGLIDQILPPSDHIYGIKYNKTTNSEIEDMLNEGHKTDLGNYIKAKDEIYYKRHKTQPLGKSMDYGYILPKYTKEDTFAFGLKSEKSESGTKELVEIDTNLKIPTPLSKLPMNESVKAEKEIVAKKNLFYNWNKLNIDPIQYTFGKPPRDKNKEIIETTASALKFVADEEEWNKPLNPPHKKPMCDEFIYGQPPKKIKGCGVKECIHTDVIEKKNILKRDLPENQTKIVINSTKHISSRNDPNRVKAKDLLNPGFSEKCLFAQKRNIEEIIDIYKCSGNGDLIKDEYIPKIKQILKDQYNNHISLANFKSALDVC